jgi:starch-binding outer membrane protein, SusD/RagB family
MNKIITIIIGLIGLVSLNSCDDYLSVNPKTQMTQDVLYSSESGFKDALTGVYIQMKSNSIYGQSLSITTIEQLISNWNVTANTLESKIGLYNYTDASVETQFNNIFSKQYSVVANINAILAKLEEKHDVFKNEQLYKLIKGECLGLRAYCHFDVLRLWGPVPANASSTNKILPYVKVLSKDPTTYNSYQEYQANLIADLNQADSLLKAVDPVQSYSLVDLGKPSTNGSSSFNPSDTYFAYRYLRLNYYAVKALEARVNLWYGNKDAAYASAKTVIQALNPDGSTKFRLGTSADMTAKDYSLMNEQIFSLYDFELNSKYNNQFANGIIYKGTTETTVKSQLYGNTGTDIREVNLWQLITLPNASKTYVCQKYNVPAIAASGFADQNRIPMLRLSELYLIAIESAPSTEAQALWATFRTARNITVTTLPVDPLMAQLELIKEYRKEFVAEGQAFYAYKRINAAKANVLWTPTAAVINYVVPLPRTETVPTN